MCSLITPNILKNKQIYYLSKKWHHIILTRQIPWLGLRIPGNRILISLLNQKIWGPRLGLKTWETEVYYQRKFIMLLRLYCYQISHVMTTVLEGEVPYNRFFKLEVDFSVDIFLCMTCMTLIFSPTYSAWPGQCYR